MNPNPAHPAVYSGPLSTGTQTPEYDVTKPRHAVDTARVLKGKDFSATDAIWVPIVGATPDDVTSTQAKIDAIRYVIETYSHDGAIDQQDGPYLDDGKKKPYMPDPANGEALAVMSAADVKREQEQFNKTAVDRRRFVCFYRIRRSILM